MGYSWRVVTPGWDQERPVMEPGLSCLLLMYPTKDITPSSFYNLAAETLRNSPKSTHWIIVEPGFGAQSMEL